MADGVDEEIEAELERQRREARRDQFRKQAGQIAKDAVKKKVKKKLAAVGRKAAARAGTAMAAEGAAVVAGAASWPLIGTILAVVTVIILILSLIFLVMTSITVICNSDSYVGRLAKFAGELTGVIDKGICDSLSGVQGVVSFLDSGQILQPPQTITCPNLSFEPPEYIEKIECENCVDLTKQGLTGIPVKASANPWADPFVAGRLEAMRLGTAQNTDFRVTEAFCPTVFHKSRNHYNGKAVDLNLFVGLIGDKARTAKLYRDAESVGFSNIRCEYPEGYLEEFGISCFAPPHSTSGHIHVESLN